MAFAGVLKQTTVADKLASQFPMTVFSGNSQSSTAVQDPVALAQGTPAPSVPSGYPNVAPNTGQTINPTPDPKTINPQTGAAYDLSDPGVKYVNGVPVWPDGHWEIGGTYTNKDTGEGFVSKGITFN